MSKKGKKQKASPKSQKEDVDLSEYEEPYDGESGEEQAESTVNYDEYELPEDFVPPEEEEKASKEEEMNWFQKQLKKARELDNYQRLYWIKIMSGCIAGSIIGLAGATTGWWLLLLVGLYAAVTASGYFLFKLEFNWKEVLLSGFFPYLGLFALFWTLMYTSLYAPERGFWEQILIVTETITANTTTITTTYSNTTSAAGFPILEIALIVVGAIALAEFLLRRQRNNKKLQ